MIPMQCQRCLGGSVRAVATNSRDDAGIVRQRRCADCGHVWFTVEVPVKAAMVGWERMGGAGQSKPVLRVPVELAVGEGAV